MAVEECRTSVELAQEIGESDSACVVLQFSTVVGQDGSGEGGRARHPLRQRSVEFLKNLERFHTV
jgi:hypothetical protein